LIILLGRTCQTFARYLLAVTALSQGFAIYRCGSFLSSFFGQESIHSKNRKMR